MKTCFETVKNAIKHVKQTTSYRFFCNFVPLLIGKTRLVCPFIACDMWIIAP